MRTGHFMERILLLSQSHQSYQLNLSHFLSRHLGTFRTVFLICLLYLLSVCTSQASPLRVAVSALDSGMAIDHVRTGLQSELTRQGYVSGSNLTWVDTEQVAFSAINMTISMTQDAPLIHLVSQHGLSTAIYLDESYFDEGNLDEYHQHNELIEHYDVSFIKKLLPGINTLGVLLDKNATDTIKVKQFLAQQQDKGINVIYYYINAGAELRASTRALSQQVEAIYLPHHITAMAELSDVVMVAERNNVALIGEDHNSIDKGIFAVYNIDYVQVGRDTADLLVRIATGDDNLNRDHYLASPVLSINLDAAARMGVELSSEVIDKAKYIVE